MARVMRIFRISAVEGSQKLPFTHKVLFENLCVWRTARTSPLTRSELLVVGRERAAHGGDPVHPGPRHHAGLHWVPCVVDLATMREAVAELGGDASQINPWRPRSWSSTTR